MKLADADLNLMVAFEALFEERSVSRAAHRLGVGQPAMSSGLARLRELFGDPLFVRVGSRMQPTPKAMILAPSVSGALTQLRSMLAEAQPFVPSQARDSFTIASTDYTTLVILPALMKKLAVEAPGVDLRIIGYDKGDVEALLAENRIDLALGVFSKPPQRAVKQTLCSERFIGVARLEHPALRTGDMTLADFCRLPHALVTVRRDTEGVVDQALAATGHSRRVVLSLPHMLVLPSILRECDLLATLPERVAISMAYYGLQCFELPFELPGWNIELLWNPVSRNNEAAAWFRGCVQAAAQEV